MRHALVSSVSIVTLLAASACGGRVLYDNVDGEGGGASTDSSGPGSPATTSSGQGGGTTVGSSGSSGSGSASSGSASSGGGSTSGSGSSSSGGGSSSQSGSSGSAGGSPPPPPPAPITCGAEVCDGNAEVCCTTFQGPGNPPAFACTEQGGCDEGAELSCSDTGSCPGNQVCCLVPLGNFDFTSECSGQCQGPGGGIQLCADDDECDDEPCTSTPIGLGVCGSFGGGGGPGPQ